LKFSITLTAASSSVSSPSLVAFSGKCPLLNKGTKLTLTKLVILALSLK
jgi:hypothetical protein